MRRHTIALLPALALAATPLMGVGPGIDIPGLRSSGTLVVEANVDGSPLNVGGTVALYHKGALYRLDVLSLGFPGTDATLSKMASTLIGPGGVSLLYDGATGRTVAWSNANRTYYDIAPPRASAAPSTVTAAPAAPSDPLAALARIASSLRNVQTATIQLVGHHVVNGHPTTDVDVVMKRQLPGKSPEDYHAQVALADDLGDFPVQIAFASVPASKSAFGGSFKLDLTTVEAAVPSDATFEVPSGYTRATSLSGVLGRAHL